MDTHTPTGRLLFGMLAVIAQFETELRAERQREGIAKAKAHGVHFGRTKALTLEQAEELRALRGAGVTLAALRHKYGIGKTALYRYLGAPRCLRRRPPTKPAGPVTRWPTGRLSRYTRKSVFPVTIYEERYGTPPDTCQRDRAQAGESRPPPRTPAGTLRPDRGARHAVPGRCATSSLQGLTHIDALITDPPYGTNFDFTKPRRTAAIRKTR